MRRVKITFLALLFLATLASGSLWIRGRSMLTSEAPMDRTLLFLSAGLLLLSLLALTRILARTKPPVSAPARVAVRSDDNKT